jgi:hypothetical protein
MVKCSPNARIWVLDYGYAQRDAKGKVLSNTPYNKGVIASYDGKGITSGGRNWNISASEEIS